MNNNPIGIFDSGIGGVTVLKEIIKVLPNEDFIYYSDSINNPYGDKNNSEIIKISDNITNFLINKNVKSIVIACNTASAVSKDFLRKKYNKPIIAIEPAYKMVYDNAYSKWTLVMATKGTTETRSFKELIHKYNNKKTYILPCIGLANAIEKNSKVEINKVLEDELKPYIGKVDNVVLGCTHYPIIKDEIKNYLGNVNFFDGSNSLAKHLKKILIEKNLCNSNENISKIEFIDSSNDISKEKRFLEILNS